MLSKSVGIPYDDLVGDPVGITTPSAFEMKNRKGVWTYEPKTAHVYFGGADYATGTDRTVWTSTPFVFFDEHGSVDFDTIEATLQGRAFAGSTDAARASGLPKYEPTDSRSCRSYGSNVLRDSFLDRQIDIRQAIDAAIRRVL